MRRHEGADIGRWGLSVRAVEAAVFLPYHAFRPCAGHDDGRRADAKSGSDDRLPLMAFAPIGAADAAEYRVFRRRSGQRPLCFATFMPEPLPCFYRRAEALPVGSTSGRARLAQVQPAMGQKRGRPKMRAAAAPEMPKKMTGLPMSTKLTKEPLQRVLPVQSTSSGQSRTASR